MFSIIIITVISSPWLCIFFSPGMYLSRESGSGLALKFFALDSKWSTQLYLVMSTFFVASLK